MNKEELNNKLKNCQNGKELKELFIKLYNSYEDKHIASLLVTKFDTKEVFDAMFKRLTELYTRFYEIE